MSNKILTLLLFFSIQTFSFAQQEAKTTSGKTVLLYEDGTWSYTDSIPLYNIKSITSLSNLEIPKLNSGERLITHTGFSLSYNESHEQANWVAYNLTTDETVKLFDRTDNFEPDLKVKTGSASDRDYIGSGYDRGHLAPASDMGWSSTAMAESFYYSNISPQTPSFNRGIWKKLEKLVRTWAVENNSVYVITGPVLSDALPSIGPNNVSVPKYFYKVILDYREPSIKAIGFILPNMGSKEYLQNYAVSVDSVESLTGINFFPSLPDDQEDLIEKTLCIKCWSWKSVSTSNEKNQLKATQSVQCNGITKAGERCKNKTLNLSGYCYQHEGQMNSDSPNQNKNESKVQSLKPVGSTFTSVQCSGTTKSGSRCKRMTTNSTGRCYQH